MSEQRKESNTYQFHYHNKIYKSEAGSGGEGSVLTFPFIYTLNVKPVSEMERVSFLTNERLGNLLVSWQDQLREEMDVVDNHVGNGWRN